MTKNNFREWFAFGGLMLMAFPAMSLEVDAVVRAGVGTSDNIARSPANEVDETILTGGLDLTISEESVRNSFSLTAQFDYMDYADDTFGSEWLGGARLDSSFTLVDERLRWIVQDTFGQQVVNPFTAANPGNRENVNVLTTGPSLNLLTGGRNQLVLDVRYSQVTFETRPLDDERTSATLRLGRDVSRATNVSVNASTSKVEFDQGAGGLDFDRHEGFLRIERRGASNTFGMDIGYTEIDSELNSGNGFLAQIDWSRQLSANTALTISGGSRYSDQGDIFRFLENIRSDLGETVDTVSVPSTFLNNFFTAGLSLQRDRYSVSLGMSWNQEDYRNGLPIDRDNTRFNLELRRNLSRSFYVGATARLLEREFKYLDQRDDDTTFGVNMGVNLSDGFSITLDFLRQERESNVAAAEFVENRAFLRLNYVPVWSR